jgi:hypothetical protein
VVFDQIFLVADLFSGLTLEGLRGGERSLYSLFETDFGVRMITPKSICVRLVLMPRVRNYAGCRSG